MTFFVLRGQAIQQRGANPRGRVGCIPGLAGDFIHPEKAKARYPCQLIRALPDNLQRLPAEKLLDFKDGGGRDVVGAESHHQIAHFIVLVVRFQNFLQLVFADARNFQQPFRVGFNNGKSVCPEFFHDSGGGFFPDSFDKAGGKVRLHAGWRPGNPLLIAGNL